MRNITADTQEITLHFNCIVSYTIDKPHAGNSFIKRRESSLEKKNSKNKEQERQKTERILEIRWAQGRTPRFRYYIEKSGGGEEMRANKAKLKKLILYILQDYNNTYLTPTKLQKLLYFCDFDNFYVNESPITGFAYTKNYYGPTILDLDTVLAEMEKEGTIRTVPGTNYYGSPQTNFSVTTTSENLEEEFGPEELLTIKEVNEKYKQLTPSEIKQLSHLDFPYLATKGKGDTIDYELVKYRDEDEEEEVDEETAKLFASKEFTELLGKVDAKL